MRNPSEATGSLLHLLWAESLAPVPDFRAPLYYGISADRRFQQVAEGLYKIDLPWHLTPFHEENLDIFLMKTKAGWCLRYAPLLRLQPTTAFSWAGQLTALLQ